MSGPDTNISKFNCHFKKIKDDSLFSSAFHYKYFYKDYTHEIMYTGEDLAIIIPKDSTATITSKKLWADYIESIKHNYTFYSPLTNKASYPMPNEEDYNDSNTSFHYLGDSIFNNINCYYIKMKILKERDTNSKDMQTLSITKEFLINKNDYLPLEFSTEIYVTMANDTMQQYENFVLDKYEINNLEDETSLTLNSIPKYYKLKDHKPYVRIDILQTDTIAPTWKLPSLTADSVSLESLKGKLVLIDFFYKSCYPCMQAIPMLQALNEKYKDKGLEVIGIDPFDTKEKGLAEFLAKRGVTYTVLLEAKEIAKKYRVSAYPTLFLIDRNGKIIYNQEGYGEGVDEELEGVIKKNLLPIVNKK